MRRMLAVSAWLGAMLALAPAVGQAGPADGTRQHADFEFTTAAPGAPSGLELRIDYVNPDDPEAKPPSVRGVVEKLARGARIDTSAPELCTASDPELMLLGADACPPASVVGSGTLTLDTGLPEPGRFVTADITFLNNTDELIFLNTVRGTGARVVVRSEIRGRRTIVNSAPFLPGAPPDGAAIDTVEVSFPVTEGGDGASYLTTPRRCPERGHRTNRIRFTYADGVTQRDLTRWRCEPR